MEKSLLIKFLGENPVFKIVDFLIENKIVLEIKVAQDFYQKDINQLLSYLKFKNFELGILAIFTKEGIKYKRILNDIREDSE